MNSLQAAKTFKPLNSSHVPAAAAVDGVCEKSWMAQLRQRWWGSMSVDTGVPGLLLLYASDVGYRCH